MTPMIDPGDEDDGKSQMDDFESEKDDALLGQCQSSDDEDDEEDHTGSEVENEDDRPIPGEPSKMVARFLDEASNAVGPSERRRKTQKRQG